MEMEKFSNPTQWFDLFGCGLSASRRGNLVCACQRWIGSTLRGQASNRDVGRKLCVERKGDRACRRLSRAEYQHGLSTLGNRGLGAERAARRRRAGFVLSAL